MESIEVTSSTMSDGSKSITTTITMDDSHGSITSCPEKVLQVESDSSSSRKSRSDARRNYTGKPHHVPTRDYVASIVLIIIVVVLGLLSAAFSRAQFDYYDYEYGAFLIAGIVAGLVATILFIISVMLAFRAAVVYRKKNTDGGASEGGGSMVFMITSWVFSALGVISYIVLSAIFAFQVKPLWIAVTFLWDAFAWIFMFLHAKAARQKSKFVCCCGA